MGAYMPTLAAVIREFDPKKYRSVDVAKILGCRDEYVRTVWQRVNPERRRRDNEKKVAFHQRKYETDHEYRANYRRRQRQWYHRNKDELREKVNARNRERYASEPAFREARIKAVMKSARKKAEARA